MSDKGVLMDNLLAPLFQGADNFIDWIGGYAANNISARISL